MCMCDYSDYFWNFFDMRSNFEAAWTAAKIGYSLKSTHRIKLTCLNPQHIWYVIKFYNQENGERC